MECGDQVRRLLRGPRAQEADNRRVGLLGVHGARPHNHTTNERDEHPAFHSMTSVAWCRMEAGTERPKSFAVFRLILKSNTVACSIGRSAGLAPLRTRSTNEASRRDMAKKLGHRPSTRR